MKFKIENRKNKMKYGYIGMNFYASKSHKIPFNHKSKKVIEIYSKVSKPVRKATIRHEEIELELMKNKHMRYKKAHKIALKHENDNSSLINIMRGLR